ncbi:MAG: hypothetical protein H7Z17_07110 [Fuerstia sp.]|nr:hypothetical protein [Fuerstiella sp.]
MTDHVGEVFEFNGRILLNGKLIMSHRFQLANILSKTLQGARQSARHPEPR